MSGTAILLSAGKSTRMGTLKALLPWQGKTLLEHQLITLQNSQLSEIIVVVGYKANLLSEITKQYATKTVYNEKYQSGKCSSIIAGLQAIKTKQNPILIVAVDQPTNATLINHLLNVMKESNQLIAVPTYHGKRGHPVIFSSSIIQNLYSIKEESKGLRSIFHQYTNYIIEVPTEHSSILLNLNTPNDFQKFTKNCN